MKLSRPKYPVIDLFAGPGGLGEGFASTLRKSGEYRFKSVAAIERDPFSHSTLLLRHFFRAFPDGAAPEDYYRYLEGSIEREELFRRYPDQFAKAERSALQISLGPESHERVQSIIEDRLAGRKLWALVGGPPCQAYSLVGRSRMMGRSDFAADERHTLYLEYLKIIADHRPPVFVMENVKGLLSATIEGKSAISRIVQDLSKPNTAIPNAPVDLTYKLYSLSQPDTIDGEVDPRHFVVRAEEYGIPQARHRMFIVGVRGDLDLKPGTMKKSEPPTVADMIGSLPAIRSTLSKRKDSKIAWLEELRQLKIETCNDRDLAYNSAKVIDPSWLSSLEGPDLSKSTVYQSNESGHQILRELEDPRLKALTSHEARGHMASDLRRYIFAASFARKIGRSPKLSDFPESLLPAHQNVELGRNGKMFSDRFRVQLADQVSTTITSHISKDGHYFIHYDPSQCRSLTVREAARLQTFPDNYKFEGPRTAQYHQVGNAVPPLLARQIANIICDLLDSMPEEE